MNWSKRTIMAIFFTATAIGVCLSVHTMVARLSAVSHCIFNFDNRLSSSVCNQVAQAIEHRVVAGERSSDIVALVVREFPCIDGITMHRCAPGVLYCEVMSVHPLVHVNNTHVVADTGALLSPDFFSPALLTTLRTIGVDKSNNGTHMPASFVVAVKELIPSLLDTHDAQWIDDKKIVLQEKQAPHFSVVCSADRLPNERLLAYCQQLRDDMASRSVSSKKIAKMQQWSADIRFEHQIVLCGGVAHG